MYPSWEWVAPMMRAMSLATLGFSAMQTIIMSGFYINTPMGKYNPDWAIALKEGDVKHIYFVAETKGSLESGQLRGTEAAKIECARQHFQTISSGDIKYDVVTSYSDLMDAVMN